MVGSANAKEDDTTVQINFELKGITKDMFLAIKRKYNLKYNMETFRLIVKKSFDIEFPEE